MCKDKTSVEVDSQQRFITYYQKYNKKIILREINLAFDNFKDDLLNEVLEKIPCSSTEIDRLLSDVYEKNRERFMSESVNKIHVPLNAKQAVKLYKIKCKAQEGYIRYFNDYYSLKLIYEIKKNIAEEIYENEIDKEQILGIFYKQAKGTYMLQGFEEIRHIINEDIGDFNCIIDKQFQESILNLQLMYTDLTLSKIIDLEIYNKTIGIIQKELTNILQP